jgi:hypothetical protein
VAPPVGDDGGGPASPNGAGGGATRRRQCGKGREGQRRGGAVTDRGRISKVCYYWTPKVGKRENNIPVPLACPLTRNSRSFAIYYRLWSYQPVCHIFILFIVSFSL